MRGRKLTKAQRMKREEERAQASSSVTSHRGEVSVTYETSDGEIVSHTSEREEIFQPRIFLAPRKRGGVVKKDQTSKKQTQIVERTEHHPLINTPCECGRPRALRTVTCFNCVQYPAACRECFAQHHVNQPFHWAEVWHDGGYFVRHNLTSLGYPLRLGHHGGQCENGRDSIKFEVFAETGVHAIRVHFCGCNVETLNNRVAQLLDAQLFPCTGEEPKSAITFGALRLFQIVHLEGKTPALDFCSSIRRLSNDWFTEDIPDMYENFGRCARLWGHLTTTQRMGQQHGIDTKMPQRPPGNTVLYCPSCPEPGFNMDPHENMKELPPHLRHLCQQKTTADGNFHCTKSKKTSDPNDRSLFKGTAFFPTHEQLEEALKDAPQTSEKSKCNYLNAVNNQDKKKFKNMEITGIVNIQCCHVFVKSSVDLQLGERFANVDLALALAISQKLREGHSGEVLFKIESDRIDQVMTYDVACQYKVHVVERFRKKFPKLAPIVEKMRWGIPIVHIQGHGEECTYKHGTAYMEAVGHFHGETAEHYWPELNQIGTQVTQMSGGHRHDVVIMHHNDWNHKKFCKACPSSYHLLLSQNSRVSLQLHC
ncbi:hypothetical protein R3P38DRAFT_3326686 [Favolaschia claudopus]|uniref:CxC2-like cysteine cluster KDZ transposase-associated domain-containing protein n=1 Tax=Favolaschia claudopus TaxID=2862362 RepID=A0AAW0A6Q2_9AGAR